jgi:hypothetical protein
MIHLMLLWQHHVFTGYQKSITAAALLRKGGTLVLLLWNMPMNPVHASDLKKIELAHEPDCQHLLVWSDEDK